MTLPVDYANATVSLDTHPDAHNETNAAVNALETKAIPAGGATGEVLAKTHPDDYVVDWVAPTYSTIIADTGAPDLADGGVSDYYLDTTNHVLYGPKADPPSESPMTFAGTPNDNNPAEMGLRVQFLTAGTLTQVQYQRLASCDDTITIRVWNDSSGPALSTVTDTRPGEAGTFTVTLPAPLTIAVNDIRRVTYSGPTIGAPFLNPGTTITGTATMTLLSRCSSGSPNAFPTNTSITWSFYVSPLYAATAAPIWPVAVYGIPPGGTTNQFLKKTSAVDYAVAWVT